MVKYMLTYYKISHNLFSNPNMLSRKHNDNWCGDVKPMAIP